MNKRIKYTCGACGGKYSNRIWKEHLESKRHIKAYKNHKWCYLEKSLFDYFCKERLGSLFDFLPKVTNENCNWRIKTDRK